MSFGRPMHIGAEPIERKLQRLHALRAKEQAITDQRRALELEIDMERDVIRDRAGNYAPVNNRRIDHIETPPAERKPQDFEAWARNRAEMEDL